MGWFLVVQGKPRAGLVDPAALHIVEADDAQGAADQFYVFAFVIEGQAFGGPFEKDAE